MVVSVATGSMALPATTDCGEMEEWVKVKLATLINFMLAKEMMT